MWEPNINVVETSSWKDDIMTTIILTLCTEPIIKRKPQRHARLAVMVMLAIMFVSPLSLIAQVASLHSTPGRDKIRTDLLAKLESEPQSTPAKARSQALRYKIIVSLQRPPTLQANAIDYRSSAGRSQIQQHVEAMQNTVLQTPTPGSLTVWHRYENLFSFSAMADRDAILSLVAQDAVVRIEEMPVMYKMDIESHALTNVNNVHRTGFTGQGVTIAIIDDGIDVSHKAFGGSSAWPNDKILGGYDFADNDNDPRIDCVDQSHGTAVAGVAAGSRGEILGTAPNAKLVFLKVQSAAMCGAREFDGDPVAAIDWVVTNRDRFGIDIISISFGGGAFSRACDSVSPYRQAVNAAHEAGITLFAAAGNEAQTNAISQPACLSNVISVGAVYDDDIGVASFGNCIDTITHADRVTCYSNSAGILDILAPADCANTARAGGGTDACFNGTSSATPFTAGVAAALLEGADRDLNPDQMRSLLVDNSVAIADPKSDWITPRIDADAALQALRSSDPIGDRAPCTNCERYTGNLAQPGAFEAQPDGTYYSSPSAGTHRGWLRGPDSTNFDLYLYQWNGAEWVVVAQSLNPTSEEVISYSGSRGYYTWVIHAVDGSGSYDFWLQQPST